MTQTHTPILQDATRDLAIFGSALQFEQIPTHVVDWAKLCVLDSLGCGLYGMTTPWIGARRAERSVCRASGPKRVYGHFGCGRGGYGGFLSTFSGEPHPELLTKGLGTVWETCNVGFKPYATVASIQSALDSLRNIMIEAKACADDVERVEASMNRSTYMHAAWKYEQQGVTAAQMNLFYSLAAIAVDGNAFVEQFQEERLGDPRLLEFIEKVTASIDPEIESMGRAGRHSTKMKVTLKDGRTYQNFERERRGGPGNRLSSEDIRNKFRALASYNVKPGRIQEIIETVDHLETVSEIDSLCSLLSD